MRGIRLVTRDFERVLLSSGKLCRAATVMARDRSFEHEVKHRAALYRDHTGRLIARASWSNGGPGWIMRVTDYGAHEP